MERKIASLLAKKMIVLTPSESLSIVVLAYGLELIITSLIGVFLLMVWSIFSSIPWAWFFFLLGFAPLRTVAGGYHAPTHLLCYFITTIAFSCCVSIAKCQFLTSIHLLIMTIVTNLIVIFLSPIASNNKPLSKERRVKNRMRSISVAHIQVLISIILCLIRHSDIYTNLFILGGTTASLSLIVAKIINWFREEDNYGGVHSSSLD